MEAPEYEYKQVHRLTVQHVYKRTAGVLLAPRRTLFKTAFEPGGWIPILVVSIALAIIRLILLPEVMHQYSDPGQLQKYAEERNIPEAEAQKELDLLRRTAPAMTMLETPFLVAAGVALIAFFVYFIGKVLFQKTIAYMVIFRVISWASIVSAIPLVLSIPLKLINPSLDLPTNPAFLLPAELTGKYIYYILQTIDIFLIWQVWLISVGISELYNISTQRAISAIGTMFIIFIILNAVTFSITL